MTFTTAHRHHGGKDPGVCKGPPSWAKDDSHPLKAASSGLVRITHHSDKLVCAHCKEPHAVTYMKNHWKTCSGIVAAKKKQDETAIELVREEVKRLSKQSVETVTEAEEIKRAREEESMKAKAEEMATGLRKQLAESAEREKLKAEEVAKQLAEALDMVAKTEEMANALRKQLAEAQEKNKDLSKQLEATEETLERE